MTLIWFLMAFRCHVPVSEKTLLGMAAATGELQLYTLSDRQVTNTSPDKSICFNFLLFYWSIFLHIIVEHLTYTKFLWDVEQILWGIFAEWVSEITVNSSRSLCLQAGLWPQSAVDEQFRSWNREVGLVFGLVHWKNGQVSLSTKKWWCHLKQVRTICAITTISLIH